MSHASISKLAKFFVATFFTGSFARSICGSRATFLVVFLIGLAASAIEMKLPIRDLFSHPKHESVFTKNSIQCTDCHNFAIRHVESGPLAPSVPFGHLKAPKNTCHQCHMGPSRFVKPTECALCHANLESIQPKDHATAWKIRHGKIAQMNRESCTQCHTTSSCKNCHMLQDRQNPNVHPGNFRLFHSIQARLKPQTCVECHKARSFCIGCHKGR
jgi:nitrate/TMAO reductase-like tetraheme cytochrome c subunit